MSDFVLEYFDDDLDNFDEPQENNECSGGCCSGGYQEYDPNQLWFDFSGNE